MDELIPIEENIVLQDYSSTHIDNGDGTFTAIISNGMNYLSSGEWKDMQYYFLEQIGQYAWSNMSDEFPCSIIDGEVITENYRWKVDGIYIGDNKIWTPDFTNYTKYGDTIEYEMPFGILQYIIRPDMYKEQFIFNSNPFNGLCFDADELTIKYIGETDGNVWAKDANGRSFDVKKEQFTKSVKTIDFYTAKYPFTVDPSLVLNPSGDITAETNDSITYNSFNSDLLGVGCWDELTPKGAHIRYVWYRSAMRFNLTSLTGTNISQAELKLNTVGVGTSQGSEAMFLYSTANTADPTTLTSSQVYNMALTRNLGQIPIGAGLKTFTLNNSNNSSYISELSAKQGSYETLYLYCANTVGADTYIDFASSDHANSTLRPSFTITYTVATGYTVTFDSNGGSSVSPITNVSSGSLISAPTPPTKTGYTFAGWYEDNTTFANPWVFASETMPANNKILYAKWTANTYVATWFNNGGTGVSPATTNQTFGSATILPTTNPTRTGYTLTGFWDAISGGTQYTTPTVSSRAWDKTVNTNLYAQWTINQYAVSYNSNGGSAVSGANVTYGSLITQPSSPTKSGYVFAGWYEDNTSFSNTWIFGSETMPANSLTLYAKWVAEITITFDANGGWWS